MLVLPSLRITASRPILRNKASHFLSLATNLHLHLHLHLLSSPRPCPASPFSSSSSARPVPLRRKAPLPLRNPVLLTTQDLLFSAGSFDRLPTHGLSPSGLKGCIHTNNHPHRQHLGRTLTSPCVDRHLLFSLGCGGQAHAQSHTGTVRGFSSGYGGQNQPWEEEVRLLEKRLQRFAVEHRTHMDVAGLARTYAGRDRSELDDYLYYHHGEDLSTFEQRAGLSEDGSDKQSAPGGGDVEGEGKFGSMGKAAAGVATLGYLSKFKGVLAALKLTKFASLGSMVISSLAYSLVFGWPYAVGMVSLMLIHESGHALMMLYKGIPFGPMVFIPFMGAAVEMKRRPNNCYEEAQVAMAGPVLGSVGAAAFAMAGLALDSQLLLALADFGFMINLFNLAPIGSLDGGYVLGALSKWALVLGLVGGGALAYSGAVTNPILYLILVLGGVSTFKRFTASDGLPPSYWKLTAGQRLTISVSYFGLLVSLLVAMQVLFPWPPSLLVLYPLCPLVKALSSWFPSL